MENMIMEISDLIKLKNMIMEISDLNELRL